ncbi:hypothetical protein [Streptomyces sp. ME19-01-6]|uniref:acyl-CoA-like ligand-binding transcription factor n=1 Tax=Streptomyces sp. ME19-01-6 TaxID=3028686 RepID=UPI0039F5FDCD
MLAAMTGPYCAPLTSTTAQSGPVAGEGASPPPMRRGRRMDGGTVPARCTCRRTAAAAPCPSPSPPARPPTAPASPPSWNASRSVARTAGPAPAPPPTRLRLVADTPALQAGMATVFSGFEQLALRVTATSLHEADDDRRPRLVAAAAVAAFRVGLDMWVASDARTDLARLVLDNLDDLTTGILAGPRAEAGEGSDSRGLRQSLVPLRKTVVAGVARHPHHLAAPGRHRSDLLHQARSQGTARRHGVDPPGQRFGVPRAVDPFC